ncbi:hypothetical protein PF011_g8120 [Phytophthora fragariae]|nr:hypothetical protein PF011_g8120 [Phytophthora fragariae]
MNDEQIIEQIVTEVLDANSRNAAAILTKIVERGLRCPRYRSLTELPKRGVSAKRVSFDCFSLFASRSEALGTHGSRYDRDDSIYEYVYAVSAPSPKQNRKAGLLEGEIAVDVTALVKGLVDLDATVRVARSLCIVQEKKVIVEVCNPSTEKMIIKKGTPLAAISVVPESAFNASTASSPADGAEPFSLEENASSKRESDWIHAAISASPTAENTSSESMPELDKVLETELKVEFSDSKLGGEQKELFSGLLNSFRDLFVGTSLKSGRTDLLEFSIDAGDSGPIKQ